MDGLSSFLVLSAFNCKQIYLPLMFQRFCDKLGWASLVVGWGRRVGVGYCLVGVGGWASADRC